MKSPLKDKRILCFMDGFEEGYTPKSVAYFHKDSTHLILLEMQRRGAVVLASSFRHLSLTKNGLFARTFEVQVLPRKPYFRVAPAQWAQLKFVDLILIRKDPPFDDGYLTGTHLLSLLSKVPVLNPPQALRDFNEKLIIHHFPTFIPHTLVTSEPNLVKHFLKTHGKIVMKDLASFGGRGVQLLQRESQLPKKLASAVQLQPYIPGIEEGEKRVFIVEGKVIGVLLRKPKKKSWQSNPDLGGTLHKTSLTKFEKKICKEVGAFLKRRGIVFAGIDLIDEKLTEINITSPGMIAEYNQVYKENLERKIVDRLSKRYPTSS